MDKSEKIEKYFKEIDKQIAKAYKVAKAARKKGFDPEKDVEIPLVVDMAERVEGLISVVAPQIVGSGVSTRIKKLEKEYGSLDWRIALTIALEIAQGKFIKFGDKKEAMEIGIRAGIAYITMGVVASPLEGFVELRIRKTRDGKEYLAINYGGPIRSAGGTAAAVSIIIVDYVRKNMGYDPYDPTEEEVKRTITELYDFHERITNLQYLPSEVEIEFLVKHLPVQVDGDGSEKIEVSNYRDLDRIETNRLRNGVCLVIGEALAQKAPKVWKQLDKWGKDFGLDHWNFMGEFVELQKKIKAKGKADDTTDLKIAPDYTYIKDMVAGRPVFSHPLRNGGFRLRFGRTRTSGYSSNAVHPATMHILNQYIATGTQIKAERPGKAATLTACDSLEGPIVKLNDGSVLHIQSLQQAKTYYSQIKEILYLGDMLVNYGDFFNRAHNLVPPGYCVEWWVQEVEKQTVNLFGSLDMEKLSELVDIPSESLELLIKNPFTIKISAHAAITLAHKADIPLHPDFTYFWRSISKEQLLLFLGWWRKCNKIIENGKIQKAVLPLKEEPKRVMELLGIPHVVSNNEFVVFDKDHLFAIEATLHLSIGIDEVIDKVEQAIQKDVLDIINHISDITLRDKAGVFIGARMGRPEKAKMRRLTGSPHVLFPIGEEGGRFRSFQSALEVGHINSRFPIYTCSKCEQETIFTICEECKKPTTKKYICTMCGIIDTSECQHHGPAASYRNTKIDIKHYFTKTLKLLGMKVYPDLIKGVKGTSNKDHIPEHIAKGILRAKHEIYVNKDGTTRYDMTQLPLTHITPTEIGTSVPRLKELGYTHDIYGKKFINENQVLEIFPQDIVLPSLEPPLEGGDKVLFRVANFVDELLVSFYKEKPFYQLSSKKNLVGHLVLCLAPHTSAGIVARIIGFSKNQALFAHPLLHAATRRDCDGDEACVILLVDALLNFSRKFLPAHRGSTQDAPLVLTSRLTPSEVDDMVFDLDIAWQYPLEFYEACLQYKKPWDIKIDQLGQKLGTPEQYEGMGFTHPVTNINETIHCSAYKTLPTMEEKLRGQMQIAAKVRAVDTSDVARLVVEKHFLKDTKGNLRKFSMQEFRCVHCNEKYRRPPLVGHCIKCKGRIIFTISEGSVVKYLGPTIKLVNTYDIPVYLKQSIALLQRTIESVFGKDKERQEGLTQWI